MSEPKFKVGDSLRDTITKKSGVVSCFYLSKTDVNNNPNPAWCYSIDPFGWLFYFEEDLEEI